MLFLLSPQPSPIYSAIMLVPDFILNWGALETLFKSNEYFFENKVAWETMARYVAVSPVTSFTESILCLPTTGGIKNLLGKLRMNRYITRIPKLPETTSGLIDQVFHGRL